MKDCNKRCIANVGWKCAVRECRGEIAAFDIGKPLSPEQAAEDYEIISDTVSKYLKEKAYES